MEKIYEYFSLTEMNPSWIGIYLFWFIAITIMVFGIYWIKEFIQLKNPDKKNDDPAFTAQMAFGGFILIGFFAGLILSVLWPLLLFIAFVSALGESIYRQH